MGRRGKWFIIKAIMQLLFIRHGDPDYVLDSLTPEGEVQAKALASYLEDKKIESIYCSTLGRAKKTASYTLEKRNQSAEYLEWMEEFHGKCEKPNRPGITEYCWDWLPADWTSRPILYDKDRWFDDPVFEGTNVKKEALRVIGEFDNFLAQHGYERSGQIYRAVKPNTQTLAIFCHLGIQCIFLSHLIGCSPFVLLHGFVPSPSSITTVVTEERIEEQAFFRITEMGAVPHLRIKGLEPSFPARFCECYYLTDQRH